MHIAHTYHYNNRAYNNHFSECLYFFKMIVQIIIKIYLYDDDRVMEFQPLLEIFDFVLENVQQAKTLICFETFSLD